MLKRFNIPACPVETALLMMGDRWKVLIVRNLLTGTKRFGELKKGLDGISQKVLTDHLRIMEENGLVNRKVYAEVPPKVEYSLTELGLSLKSIHDAMRQWGEQFKASIDGNPECDKKD
ncbi:MAG: helix-turn-helix transcriptional regulator [Spirochaetaceae bacterium]|jgi:DNA-binding HxlR family transcriptional regulator|nr:helix-turn-helix transcriptional regulator [Spirochaetaceae bacterium]